MAETNQLDVPLAGRPRRRRKSRRGLSAAAMYTIILGSAVGALGIAVVVLLLQAQSTSAPMPLAPAVRPQSAPAARSQTPPARPQAPAARPQVLDPAPAVPDSWLWTPPRE